MKKLPKIQTERVAELFDLKLGEVEKEIFKHSDLWIEAVPLGHGDKRNLIHSLVEAAILYPSTIRSSICKKYIAYLEKGTDKSRLELFKAIRTAIWGTLAHIATNANISAPLIGAVVDHITTYAIRKSLRALCS